MDKEGNGQVPSGLGRRHEEMPTTILTRKEWFALPKELTRGRRTITHKLYGTIQPPNYVVLFLNVQKHRELTAAIYLIFIYEGKRNVKQLTQIASVRAEML